MACNFDRPDQSPCPYATYVDPTGKNADLCAFHIPNSEKNQWPVNARSRFKQYLINGVRQTNGDLVGAQIPSWINLGQIPWESDIFDFTGAVIDSSISFNDKRGSISLKDATVNGSLTLTNCRLDTLRIDGLTIHQECDLNGTSANIFSACRSRFLLGLKLSGNTKLKDPRFQSTIFGAEGVDSLSLEAAQSVKFYGTKTDFGECAFWGPASLSFKMQTDEVDFRGTEFHGAATFNHAEFGNGLGLICFDLAQFHSGASFLSSNFREPVSFRDISAKGTLDLSGSHFTNASTISGAEDFQSILARNTTFHNLTISGVFAEVADFTQTRFAGPLQFRSTFKKDAFFTDAQFDGYADFDECTFSGLASFSTSQDLHFKSISFESAIFNGEVSFEHRRFREETSFRRARFKLAPRFYYAELHPSITFGGIMYFEDVSKDAVKRYQALRQKCEKLRSRHEEGIFHALEQRARCKSGELPRTDQFFSSMYDTVALYGTSLSRPIIGLFFVWLASTILLALVRSHWYVDFGATINWPLVGSSALSSARNIFAPFYQFRLSLSWVAIVHLVESLLSVPLLAVFLLALRWRFRRG